MPIPMPERAIPVARPRFPDEPARHDGAVRGETAQRQAKAGEKPEQDVKVPERGYEETRDEGQAQYHRPPGHDGARSFFLKKRAGKRRTEGVRGHGKRKCTAQEAPAPAELLEQGNLEDAEGKPRDDVKPQRGERKPDDEPARSRISVFSRGRFQGTWAYTSLL